MPSYGNCINRVCIKLMTAHGSSSHCLRLLKHDQMIVDANVSDDELGRTQSHRDHNGVPMASRDSERPGTIWRRVPHHLAVQILHAWPLLGAALQSCALNAVCMSEVHVHACCTLSRAARAKEVLIEVDASCAEHGAAASASPKDGSWQLQVHLIIARRAARSDLTVCLAGDTPRARTERVPTSASSRRHSPRVRACRRTKTSDCRHRIRRRGVSPIGSEDFRYLFSDLHGPRAAATQR
jgi:hypothetical protein